MEAAYKGTPEYREALKLQAEALEIMRCLGDVRSEAADLDHMGLVWMLLGNYRKAAQFHELALEEGRLIGAESPGAKSLWRAVRLYEKALEGLFRTQHLSTRQFGR